MEVRGCSGLEGSSSGRAERFEPLRETPFLWFDDKAEEAMNFYVSIFRNSKHRAYQSLRRSRAWARRGRSWSRRSSSRGRNSWR